MTEDDTGWGDPPDPEIAQHGEQPQDVLAGQPRIGELEPDDDGLPIQNRPATSRTYLIATACLAGGLVSVGLPLRELTAVTVRSALKDLAATRATRTVGMAHAGLTRAIRHAEASDKVRRNVATLVDTPAGQEGRPSKSLTFGQAEGTVPVRIGRVGVRSPGPRPSLSVTLLSIGITSRPAFELAPG